MAIMICILVPKRPSREKNAVNYAKIVIFEADSLLTRKMETERNGGPFR